MAIVTVPLGSAGGDSFLVTLTYNDANNRIVSITVTLNTGAAQVFVNHQTFQVPAGVTTFSIPGNVDRLSHYDQGFTWSA